MYDTLTGAVIGLATAFALLSLVTAHGIYRPTVRYTRAHSVVATVTNTSLSVLLFMVYVQR